MQNFIHVCPNMTDGLICINLFYVDTQLTIELNDRFGLTSIRIKTPHENTRVLKDVSGSLRELLSFEKSRKRYVRRPYVESKARP